MSNTQQPSTSVPSTAKPPPLEVERYKAFGLEFTASELNGTMYLSLWNNLVACNVDHIRLPRQRKRNHDFLKFKNVIGYKGFRNQIFNSNKFPIGRREMETCWMKALCMSFSNWSPVAKDIQNSERINITHENWKHQMLGDAISQRLGSPRDDVELFWQGEAKKYPGLDITEIPFDVDADHPGDPSLPFYRSDWPEAEDEDDDFDSDVLFSDFGEEDDGQFDDEEMNGVEDQVMDGMDEEDVDAQTAAGPNKPTKSSESERVMFGRALVIR